MGNGCMKKTKVVEVKSPTLPALKVVVVGDSGSGKTSVIRRFVENRFEMDYDRTLDVAITSVVKKLNVPNDAVVPVELWDVPGENDVDLRKTYYLDVDAVIVVVDISHEDSLSVAGSWTFDVAEHARVSRTFTEDVPNPDGKTFAQKIRKEYLKPKIGSIPILLLGNKYDLAKRQYLKHMQETGQHIGNGILSPNKEPLISENQSEKITDTVESEVAKNESTEPTDDVSPSKSPSGVEQETNNGDLNAPPKSKEESSSKSETPDNNKVIMSNGHITNSEDTSTPPNSESISKKIHPKDSKVSISTEELPAVAVTTSTSAGSVLDDARSAITMTTSIVSILPPCVEEIEHVAEQFGFIAGVPVSAKTANGGVQEAIQSVLRRLVVEKLQKLDAKDKSSQKNKNSDILSTKSGKSSRSKASTLPKKRFVSAAGPLQEVGIIEIDEVIRRCNPVVNEAEDMTTSHAEAVQSFKMICYTCGFIDTTRTSLEACISNLKEAAESDSHSKTPVDARENVKLLLMKGTEEKTEQRGWNLVATDNDVFPNLRLANSNGDDVEENEEEKDHVNPKILKVLFDYREKLFTNSVSVIKHGGDLEALLGKLTAEVTAQEEKAWETAVAAGLSSDHVKKILSILAQDKARLRGTNDLIRDTRRSVQSSVGKIKAALLF